MRISVGFLGLVLVGLFGWRLGSTLSPDALGMAVGMLFGMLAGIPACLMVLASRQQADQQYRQPQEHQRRTQPQPKIEVHHHYHHGMQTVDQLLEELEEIEWVRKLSTENAPKRIATNQSNNPRKF